MARTYLELDGNTRFVKKFTKKNGCTDSVRMRHWLKFDVSVRDYWGNRMLGHGIGQNFSASDKSTQMKILDGTRELTGHGDFATYHRTKRGPYHLTFVLIAGNR